MKYLAFIIVAIFAAVGSAAAQEEYRNGKSEPKTIALNDSLSVLLRPILRGEYDARKEAAAHLRGKPQRMISGEEAKEMLRGRIEFTEEKKGEYGNWIPGSMAIIFNDGTKRELDILGDSWDDLTFWRYYPELDVVILEDGNDGGDGGRPIDLNDSGNIGHVGDPHDSAASPDKRYQISGYTAGGAVDGNYWFIERWNAARKRYELIGDFAAMRSHIVYLGDWIWIDNDTVSAMLNTGEGHEPFEMTIIEKQP
jgi:hypothetical protein